jgi:hypothetical protein
MICLQLGCQIKVGLREEDRNAMRIRYGNWIQSKVAKDLTSVRNQTNLGNEVRKDHLHAVYFVTGKLTGNRGVRYVRKTVEFWLNDSGRMGQMYF